MSYEPTFILGSLLPEDDPFVTGFLRMSVQREYPAGHVLVRQGEPFQNLLLILSGAVETSFFSETGRKKILTINRGICFFGASAIDGSLHTMNYACLTPTTVAVMDPERLRDWDGQMLLALAKLQKKK